MRPTQRQQSIVSACNHACIGGYTAAGPSSDRPRPFPITYVQPQPVLPQLI